MIRNLNKEFSPLKARIELEIRLFEDADLNEMNEKFRHIGFIKQNIPHCYTGVTVDNIPCFRTWFMKSEQNEQIQNYFGDLFPLLKEDEALIEGVFTNPKFRGQKIMPYVIDKISKQEHFNGINKVMAFVKISNVPSLKGFRQAGFSPFIIRHEKWRFFKRTIIFEPLNEIFKTEYEQKTKKHISSIAVDSEGVFYL
ncbi:hypothetical protein M0G43_07880 [Subsaxibacter sp. CAU 1640]|uniref:hypothetical protein n=1 Tax=Subsaxibacter sp. CAU 1640 TaxID=2933271 RepID=UPI0020068DD5|nr:hypothetical protein [Subsaxibacter sp. CAU 1640]MCK7590486.1 hypothetical protein [Subsaxibacter sp. CAU 1640]